MNEEIFYYNILKYLGKNDGKCEQEMMQNFHSFRCLRPTKEIIDGASLCGIHARELKNWRNPLK